jgi:hypothetical protein
MAGDSAEYVVDCDSPPYVVTASSGHVVTSGSGNVIAVGSGNVIL